MKVYIVIAYRWGTNSAHSYPLGVFTDKNKAIQVANEHAIYRGGKYECEVDECTLDHFDEDTQCINVYTTEISF